MDIDVKKIRIRRASTESGITLQELSDNTGISISLLSQYENGKIKPGMRNLLKIDNYLKSQGV